MKTIGWLAGIVSAVSLAGGVALAQESTEDEYAPELPDIQTYKAMLDANRQSGWIQFREFSGRQLIYFTALQVMRCQLSEIRYSIDSDRLDRRFPLGACDPQQPFNLPDDPDNKYILLDMKSHPAKTVTVQVVWSDGAGSEIITYRPCDKVGGATCAWIKTVAKPAHGLSAPIPSSESR